MQNETPVFARRPDLDALRAGAMLLGIVLHASLSFFPSFWMVQDREQASAFSVLFSAIHGFRMPLFFVMCGFFTAMQLRRGGVGSLLKRRYQRVLLPLLLGLVTIVPITVQLSSFAASSSSESSETPVLPEETTSIWKAAQTGDLAAINDYLASGKPVDAADPKHGGTPLLWAAVAGQADAIEVLLQHGANVNTTSGDGGTALIAASFLAHAEAVDVLIRHGADVNAVNKNGSTPLDVAMLDDGTTRYFASLLKLELNEENLSARKARIAEALRQHGAKPGPNANIVNLLMQMPLFSHLWFLWFLWWLIVGYAAIVTICGFLPRISLPGWIMISPARYLWLIPLTMIPQWFMGAGGETPLFGPDTSTGLIPIPHVFAYYAIFFGFGAVYFNCNDTLGQVGSRWWLSLSLGLFIILPLGLTLLSDSTGFMGFQLSPSAKRILSVFLQAAYPWLITFGLMGLSRKVFSTASTTSQYLSDSAYWLYLAHLPLIIAAQLVVKDWPIPALIKFLLIVASVTAILLWSYETMVRYTWLGRFLNGPRTRISKPQSIVKEANSY